MAYLIKAHSASTGVGLIYWQSGDKSGEGEVGNASWQDEEKNVKKGRLLRV